MNNTIELLPKVATGIEGLDEILDGGLPHHCLYLVKGESGTGKTTVGLQFLLEGARLGQSTLYITLSESIREISAVAASHGWSLENIHVHEMSIIHSSERMAVEQTIFPTSQVELNEVTDEIIEAVMRTQPERIVFDSLHEISLLAETPLRYRHQILGIRQVMVECGATVLFLDREATASSGATLHSLVHGVITLEQLPREYGDVRRRLRVAKMRGMPFHEGYHDFRIHTGGIEVYPRLYNHSEDRLRKRPTISSGLTELDALLDGGLEPDTACLLTGQTGTGKTTIALLFALSVARRGGQVAIFLFEERLATLNSRMSGLGMDLRPFLESGHMRLYEINSGEISPGEFAHKVIQEVKDHRVEVVIIDSLNGYLNAMPQERQLLIHMHELLTYLSRRQVLTLLTLTHHGMLGSENRAEIDMSYLADTVLLLRHFEASGVIRQAISVVKKRHGHHEKSIREMQFGRGGVQVGEPLTSFQGILTGYPVFTGQHNTLLDRSNKGEGNGLAGE
ncbi:MAG: AAA family ATPase [Caldilineaceae bacterium]|nr:AAA family ATPase [Caldilineaceae bacterium]